ncbi:MAG: hypothetical protein H7Z74_10820, partial [Anaerolineae bacterium]|nr:hypothetical protein [Gemmatimonadaceae bacterium]
MGISVDSSIAPLARIGTMDRDTSRLTASSPRSRWRRHSTRAHATFIVLGALLAASCSKTTDQTQVLELRDGTKQQLRVSLTRGFGGPDFGLQTEVVLHFTHGGISYTWRKGQVFDQDWVSPPDIVDFVDGDPIVVFPVNRFDECHAYGFPQAGMIAERFDGAEWKRVDIAGLPVDLRLNWPRSSWDQLPKLQTSLPELVSFYREFDYACAEIYPAPDAARDATLRQLIKLEADSPVLEPQPAAPDSYSDTTRAALVSASRRVRRISANCAGLIDEIDGFSVENGIVRGINEVRWVPREGKRLRFQVPGSIDAVFCDADSVYVATTPMVYRLSRGGDLRDGIKLSDEKLRSAHSPGNIVSLAREHGQLFLLWSAAEQCENADPSCWTYTVPWPEV